jgi:hypothetical protein
MRLLIGVAVTAMALIGCASRNYRPAVEEPLSRVVQNGCGRDGDTVIVTGQVSQAYENRIVLTDSVTPATTLTIDLPGRGSPAATMRRWVGSTKYELTAQKLNELHAQGTPVTATLECKGPRVAAVARNIEFLSPDGTRVAIAY